MPVAVIAWTTTVVVTLTLWAYFRGEVWSSLALTVLGALLMKGIDIVSANPWPLRYWVLAGREWNRNVRISISALYRIELDGQFLLVRSRRFPDRFQPVGGVLKRYSSARGTLTGLNVLNDNVVPIDEESEGDLRVRVPGRHLFRFLRWYRTASDREITGWREFYEELVRTKVVSAEDFPYISERYVRRHCESPRYSQWAGGREIFIAEIFELETSEIQRAALRRTRATPSSQIVWTTTEAIERHGVGHPGTARIQIAEHAKWVL